VNPDDPAIFADFGKIFRLLITFEPALVTGRLMAAKDDENLIENEESRYPPNMREPILKNLVLENYF